MRKAYPKGTVLQGDRFHKFGQLGLPFLPASEADILIGHGWYLQLALEGRAHESVPKSSTRIEKCLEPLLLDCFYAEHTRRAEAAAGRPHVRLNTK